MGQHQEEQRSEAPVGEAPTALAHYHMRFPPAGRSPEAQRRYERFERDCNQRLRKDVSLALAILIWGPGIDVDSPIGAKRWEIKRALEAQGHAAFFSEEVREDEDLQELLKPDVGFLLKAVRHAENADYMIVLLDDRAQGVISELRFCSRPEIAAKVFILVPQELEKMFLRATIDEIRVSNGAICGYTPEQLEESYVLTATLDRVLAKRLQMALLS